MRSPQKLRSFALVAALALPLAVQADTPALLAASQVDALLNCPISLEAAQDNLKARGYLMDAAAGGFVTQYKRSDKDSVRRLLGSFAIERARRYQVVAVSDAAIRFTPGYRETEYATGVLGNNRDQTREYVVPLTVAMHDTLKDMRQEVCNALPQAAPAAPDPGLTQYLRERCQAGDDKACQHLPKN